MPNPLYDALFAPLADRDTALLILACGTTMTGAAFHALTCRTAHALRAAGLTKGARLAAQIEKSPQALACYAAATALGAVFVPLNTAYTAAELDHVLGNAAPAVFLCDPDRATDLQPLADRHGVRLLTLNGTQGSLAHLATRQPDRTEAARWVADCADDDLAAILYTSGTTGRSKGAMLTHANLLSNARTLADLWRFSPDDTLLHALPIFHTHGLFVATNIALLTGGRMIFLPGFDTPTVLRLMPQATAMMGVPTFYSRLLADPGFDRSLTGHMRLFVSGSAPLLADTHTAFHARTGHRILERYGMTETSMNTSNPYDGDRRPGTVGLPLPDVDLRIMGDAGPLPPGEVGVIEVRGPNVFAGYWQMPDKTAEDLRPDGWFITGDLGVRAPDGYVTIVGRAKDLIITGGYNVYPREVELRLDAVPGVLESAVIGLPHPDFGEAVFAVLTPRPGVTLDPAAVLAAIAPDLARFKQPKAAVVLPDLPRNTMGKVQKALLRAQFHGRF